MSKVNRGRREFLRVGGLGVLGLGLYLPLCGRERKRSRPADQIVYVGTYTSGKSVGIYILHLDSSSGELKQISTVKGVENPSFLTVDPHNRYLYAVNEVTELAGKPSGAVSSFAIDQTTGDLRFLNQQPSLGGAPCNVIVDKTGKFVLVANYVGGNVAVLAVNQDGSLGTATDLAQHKGSGLNPDRQEAAHAHCITLDSSNRYALANDLGMDKIMIYRFDSKRGKLLPNEQPWVKAKPGAGPRHFTFHPNGRYAYVINELDSSMTAFAYDRSKGRLSELQTVSALPKGFSGTNTSADIHVSPSGKFLYGSNRGHDSIVAFKIDERTGKLSYIEHYSTGGKKPRNFAIDPSGAFLLAANQDSDTIVTFRIDPETGRLKSTGNIVEVPSPVCLKMIPAFS